MIACVRAPLLLSVELISEDTSNIPVVKNGMFTSNSYIGHRQDCDVGYLPVRGVAENSLFRDYIVDAVARGKSLGAMSTFEEMLGKWNRRARGTENRIFKK